MVHSVRMHIKMPYRENMCLIFRNTEGDSQASLSVWLCEVWYRVRFFVHQIIVYSAYRGIHSNCAVHSPVHIMLIGSIHIQYMHMYNKISNLYRAFFSFEPDTTVAFASLPPICTPLSV